MKGLRQFAAEARGVIADRKTLVSVIAVIMIPVLYSGMFLTAFWDPYDKLDLLPVAIVNLDEGAAQEGQPVHIGDDLADKLKENRQFDWHFVDKATAEAGLRDLKYYMAIELPQDLSVRTTTLTTSNPTPAEIRFLPNESYNFLAAQIGETAIETLKSEVGGEVTRAYAQTMLERLGAVADGLAQASSGAGDLASGAAQADAGANELESRLRELAAGAERLNDGILDIDEAAGRLEAGASELATGLSELSGGLTQLSSAGERLAEGAGSASDGGAELAEALRGAVQGSQQLAAGSGALAQALEQFAALHPESATDPLLRQIAAAAQGVQEGAEALERGQQELSAGADRLAQGLSQQDAGLQQFLGQLQTAAGGGQSLAAGAVEVQSGLGQLNAGVDTLAAGAGALSAGAAQLDGGALQLADGLAQLAAGSDTLSASLGDAARQSASIDGSDAMIDMFAEPVQLSVERGKEVPNYGTGFAPYFLSLGLYVGAMLLTIVFAVKDPAGRPANGWSWFVGKSLTMVMVGIVQALIADAVLLFGLGLDVQSVPAFIGFSIVTSVAFMLLIQFLVTAFGNPGRFIAIVLLIFQLTSSAGTFPLELLPDWLQAFNAWLPMTYSVSGLKAVISSGNYRFMMQNEAILIGFAAVSAILTLAVLAAAYRKGLRDAAASASLSH